jgi:hypothetical protein
MPITFLEIEVGASGPPSVALMCVDRNAQARSSS